MKPIIGEVLEHGFRLRDAMNMRRAERGIWAPTYQLFGQAALWEVQYDPSLRHVPRFPAMREAAHFLGVGDEVMGVDRKIIKSGKQGRLEVVRSNKVRAPYKMVVTEEAGAEPLVNPDNHAMVQAFLQLTIENAYEQADDVSGRRAQELYEQAANGLEYLCEHHRRQAFDGRAYLFNVANKYAVRIASYNKHLGGQARYSRFAGTMASVLLRHQEIIMRMWRTDRNDDWAINMQLSASGNDNKMVMGRAYLADPPPELERRSVPLDVDQISSLTTLFHNLCILPEYSVSVPGGLEALRIVSLTPTPVDFNPAELMIFDE